MKIWTTLAAVPIALIASQALAENWVTVHTDNNGDTTIVDKDSIRRGSDGLVYFADQDGIGDDESSAADCPRRITYLLRLDGSDNPDWRDHGQVVQPNSADEAELQYVCANAG